MTNNTQILPLHFIFLVDLLLLSPWKKKQLLDYFESGVTHKKKMHYKLEGLFCSNQNNIHLDKKGERHCIHFKFKIISNS